MGLSGRDWGGETARAGLGKSGEERLGRSEIEGRIEEERSEGAEDWNEDWKRMGGRTDRWMTGRGKLMGMIGGLNRCWDLDGVLRAGFGVGSLCLQRACVADAVAVVCLKRAGVGERK